MIPRPRVREPEPAPPGPPAPARLIDAGDPAAGEPADDRTLVRPFFVTGGRTRPLHDGLRLHTLVTAPPSALHAPLRFEMRRIVELCQFPLSVAEVAARLAVPVGVARVLIGDLLTGGYVYCHDQDGEALPIDVIERIVNRVRAL